MRALVLRDWWKLDVADVSDPDPGPEDVILDIVATGICGSDIHGFTGENGRRVAGQVMGHETVGYVSYVGSAVTDRPELVIGAAATVNPVLSCGHCEQCLRGREQACPTKSVIGVTPALVSAFAERLVAPAANVVVISNDVPIELGALVEPLAVGYHALRRGECSSEDAVLVIGGGPIGQACVLAAQRLGASVAVLELVESRRHLIEQIGATAIDPAGNDVASTVQELFGRGPTLVVDAVGSSGTLKTALDLAPIGARVVLVGMGQKELSVSAFALSTEERSIIGSFCYSAAEFAETAAWIAGHADKLGLLVQARVCLEDGEASFGALARGESDASKILVLFGATR